MNKPQQSPSRSSHGVRWGATGHPGVSEFIRSAERFVQMRNYAQALDQLAQAQNFEPENKYIGAIIERVLNLQKSNSAGTPFPQQLEDAQSPDPSRYLSVTVGNEFDGGIKPLETESPESTRKYNDLIKEFTRIAQDYARLGLPEAAFDALMKAYLIDPVSPEVVACERDIIPMWLRSRRHDEPAQSVPDTAPPVTVPPATSPSQHAPQVTETPAEQGLRLELLKQQKELERQEAERAVWREASRPPVIYQKGPDDTATGDANPEVDLTESKKGFFGRFRRKGAASGGE